MKIYYINFLNLSNTKMLMQSRLLRDIILSISVIFLWNDQKKVSAQLSLENVWWKEISMLSSPILVLKFFLY